MTRTFWYHLGLAVGLHALAYLLAGVLAAEGQALGKVFVPGLDGFPHIRLLPLALSPLLLYQIARATIRLNRSDSNWSYIGLYAAAISLPILFAVMPSTAGLFAMCLGIVAVLDIMDARLYPRKTLRAGLLLGFGALLNPSLLFMFALLLVPVMVVVRGNRYRLQFVAGMAAPLLLALTAAQVFGWEGLRIDWGIEEPSLYSFTAALRGDMTPWRFFSDTYFLAAYTPFLLAALTALTVAKVGIDRGGTFIALWLAAGLGACAALGLVPRDARALTWAITVLMMIGAANAGFRLLVSSGGDTVGRVWAWMLAALFMTPPLLGWIRLAAER